jgi:hypothetical protein
MILSQFSARLRGDRLIGFLCPEVTAGVTYSLHIVVTQAHHDRPRSLYKVMVVTLRANKSRRFEFSVPPDVPLGTFDFSIILSPL